VARDASGTYTRVSNSFTAPVLGTTIDPDHADALWDELDTEITDSLSRTGKGGMFSATAIPAGGTAGTGLKFSSTSNFGVFFGSGAPTLAAAQGSLYLRSDGSSTSTRAYINTNGSTTWTAITTVA
jgi:hypothetical protein